MSGTVHLVNPGLWDHRGEQVHVMQGNDMVVHCLIEIHRPAHPGQVHAPGRNKGEIIVNLPIITFVGCSLCLLTYAGPTARQGLPVRRGEAVRREFGGTLVRRSGLNTLCCCPQSGTPAGHAFKPGRCRFKGRRAGERCRCRDPFAEQYVPYVLLVAVVWHRAGWRHIPLVGRLVG